MIPEIIGYLLFLHTDVTFLLCLNSLLFNRRMIVSYLVLLALLILSLVLRIYFTDNPEVIYEEYLIQNGMYIFMFSEKYLLYFAHIAGVSLAFSATALLKCNIYQSFLVLIFQFVILPQKIDLLYAFIAVNFFIVSIAIAFPNHLIGMICVIISGVSVAGCLLTSVEVYSLCLFPFFAYLFQWLRTNNISKINFKLTFDAIKTFILFLLSFSAAFIIEASVSSLPNRSSDTFTTKDLWMSLPSIHSRVFLASIPCLFAHHEHNKQLLFITCSICAELYRIMPVTTPGAGLSIAYALSTKFYDIASLTALSGSESKFLGILCVPIHLFVVLMCHFLRFA